MKTHSMGLLMTGGTLVGFADDRLNDRNLDIRVDIHGRIAELGQELESSDAEREYDLGGLYVSPGWIDLHAHVCSHDKLGLNAGLIGPKTGVNVLVDAGTVGEATIDGLKAVIADQPNFSIYGFLNIGSYGCMCYSSEKINMWESFDCINRNKPIIKGIKVMASKAYIKDYGRHPLVAAKRLASDLGLPTMVHIGEPPVFIEDLVDGLLEEGDIITHCFHGKIGNSVRYSPLRMLSLFGAARERGILLDVAHGASSFSYESASLSIKEGIKPDTISTDLHSQSFEGPVWSLACVMSKMLSCGLSLEDVISMVTANPAKVVGETEYAALEEGKEANFSVFRLVSGKYDFHDSASPSDAIDGRNPKFQVHFPGNTCFLPVLSVVGTTATRTESCVCSRSEGEMTIAATDK